MTLQQRADAYARAFPYWIASWPRVVREQHREVLYAIWLIGNNYRNKTIFYGAYPPRFVERVLALFPDIRYPDEILHVFSGSLPKGNYSRCDSRQEAEFRCSVYDLPIVSAGTWRLIISDPPYSAADAAHYETAPVDRRRSMAALAEVTSIGGHLCWLDTCWPMHSKKQWVTVGRIMVQRSTNHRVRALTIFERVAA